MKRSFKCYSVVVLFLAVALGACKDHGVFTGPHRTIPTAHGPEDIALDTSQGYPRIIISCAERRGGDEKPNGFYAYDPRTGQQTYLKIEGLPKNMRLHPHGIDVARVGGETLLYAVNHEEGRHGVLVFAMGATDLHFRDSLFTPKLISPNDVCTDHKGGIYVSNDSGKRNGLFEKLFKLKRSYIMHYDGTQWYPPVGDKLAYANGVGVLDGRLYVTGSQEKTVHRYDIEGSSLTNRKDLPAVYGADNITFHNGKLVSTAHLDFMAFLSHRKDTADKSPCVVFQVDLHTEQLDTLFYDNGHVLSAASTGLIVGDSLYVAQVFDPFVLALPLP